MKVSLNTLKRYTSVDVPLENLVTLLNRQLGKVEETISLKEKYKDAKVVKIVECEKHPNADRLSVCKIDANTGDLIQVVCGAPNAKAGMWAVWLPPESIVPSTFGTEEPFKLGTRELRGVVSSGMLAASDEMAIGTDHAGIIELTQDDLLRGKELEAGASFAELFSLDDIIIDIENKMFTHRPDLFGQLGVAREVAGIQKKAFMSPSWYTEEVAFADASGLGLTVINQAKSSAPRFMAVAMKDITVKSSPMWLQCALVAMGAKPINNIVDITNYVMLLTAQPTHAYDYDTLRGNTIGVRMAREGEEVKLLNGKVYALDESDIVIADTEGVLGLGGVMGGAASQVTDETRNIVLEVANFDMYAVRKTSMRHGIFTDAVTRFNKGQSSLQTSYILALLMDLVRDNAGGVQASTVVDAVESHVLVAGEAIEISPLFINSRLGLELRSDQIAQLLSNVEFQVEEGDVLRIKAPFWRTDIELPEDIVEEVGRLYGFDKLPRQLPLRSSQPVAKNFSRSVKQKIRQSLSMAGVNEVLTYSFVHKNVLEKAQQDVSQAFRLSNALSPDLQYYRLSVLPSLLEKVHMNIKAGHDEFALFEVGKGHNKKFHADNDNGLPGEVEFTDIVYASKAPKEGAAYYHMRTLVDYLVSELGGEVAFSPITQESKYPLAAPFEQGRSAIVEGLDGSFVGIVGELKQQVKSAFKLPEYVSAASLDMEGLKKLSARAASTYEPLSRFPSVERDVCFATPAGTSFAQIMEVVQEAKQGVGDVAVRTRLTDIYQQAPDSEMKNTTLHFTLSSSSSTLDRDEAAQIVDSISRAVCERLDASVV